MHKPQKKKKKERSNVNAQEKKSDNWQCDCPKKRGNVAAQEREKKEKKM